MFYFANKKIFDLISFLLYAGLVDHTKESKSDKKETQKIRLNRL